MVGNPYPNTRHSKTWLKPSSNSRCQGNVVDDVDAVDIDDVVDGSHNGGADADADADADDVDDDDDYGSPNSPNSNSPSTIQSQNPSTHPPPPSQDANSPLHSHCWTTHSVAGSKVPCSPTTHSWATTPFFRT
jgi:CCR4-NOT transcriptional regulation complex NOT5 subunit